MFQLFPSAWMLFLMYGVNLALTVLILFSQWRIFVKMGQPGWKGIIPLYNMWVAVKTMRKPPSWFWGYAVPLAPFLLALIYYSTHLVASAYAGSLPSPTVLALSGGVMFVSVVVGVVFEIRIFHALSRSFGHGVGFTVGIILLPAIFLPILAFGESVFRVTSKNTAAGSDPESEPAPESDPEPEKIKIEDEM